MSAQQLQAARQQKNDFFKNHPQAPLLPEQQAKFTALSFYDYNPELDLRVIVEEFDTQDELKMQTTTGDLKSFTRFGRFSFTVEGEEVSLTLYEADYGYFLPFTDVNAGKETYPAGRYLEPEYLGDNQFHIDFNRAYNPYCAYSPDWSCPITPPENRLKVAIRAGEKMPEGDWVIKE